MLSVASRGVLLGAAAGLVLALNDFGAMWLWLDTASDRWTLLARLAGLLTPVAAILGLLAAALTHMLKRGVARAQPRRSGHATTADSIALLLAPALVWFASELFTGGTASKLPSLWLWKSAAAALLLAGVWVAALVTQRLLKVAEAAQRSALLGAALLVLGHLLIKVNQWVLPKLYDYVHAALALVSLAMIALGIALVATRVAPIRQSEARWPFGGIAALAPLLLALAGSVSALSSNQNVAVAMLDARACHARSVLLATPAQLHAERVRRPQNLASSARHPVRLDANSDAPKSTGAHVLLITIDALRADHLGTYGYARKTSPKLDRFAEGSLVFERAYAQAPHSSYSLSSLMTSEYLHETLDLGAAPPEATLASVVAEAGYHTAAFYTLGIFHTAAERLGVYEKNSFGFALHDHRDREPEAFTDRVLEEIDRTVAQGEPNTFIWAHYFNVHEPYEATTFGTSDLDRYDSEIARADAAVTRLIEEAKKRFTRDLVVVITADHGEEFREHGGVYHGSTLYDEQVRVPLIVNAPFLAPKRVASPVEVIDIAPTVLGMIGLPKPTSMRGDDLRAVVADDSLATPAFSAVIHKRMVVKWPYKLIADLRFGLFEVYALDTDPLERKNLASADPERLDALRTEVYAWLDSLAVAEGTKDDPRTRALDQGRLGDRRAVPTLLELIADETAAVDARREACVILGKLTDPTSTKGLVAALRSKEHLVAAEAAIALGRMHHDEGQDLLRHLVQKEDPELRVRAAVSLGRLRDTASVPALIDALWIAPNDYEREEAIRWLGRLRDARALEPLISLLPESRTRHLVVIALGSLGDARGLDTLRDVLSWEHHAVVRDAVVRGLGLLKDPRGLDLVLPLAVTEPTLKNIPETLVRLGALESGAIAGSDMRPDARVSGISRCTSYSERHDWDYLRRTVCETTHASASVSFQVPEAIATRVSGATLVVGIRRLDRQDSATLSVRLGDLSLADVQVDGQWTDQHLPLDPGTLRSGRVVLKLSSIPAEARFAIDHVLILPR